MKKLLLASALTAAFAAPAAVMAQTAPAAPTPENTFTANVSVVSDYRFRGISQSYKLPAVQGGFDWSHSSGFYLGNWNSSVSGNSYPNGASLEMDFYGGWKTTIAEDYGFDVGVLYYYYPGSEFTYTNGSSKPNNFEGYLAGSWKWLTFKYSYAFSDYFGLTQSASQNFFVSNPNSTSGQSAAANQGYSSGKDSRGTMYFDLTGTYPVMDKVNLIGHVGYTRVANFSQYNYWDFKAGATYELPNSWVVGLAAVGTNADDNWWYACKVSNPTSCKNTGAWTGVLSLAKTF